MANFLTRDVKDFETRSNNQPKVIMQKSNPTKDANTLMQVRRFMNLEKRSQALVDAGVIDEREHQELFDVHAEFNFEQAEFYLEKSEKRRDYLTSHNLQRKQDPYLQLPPEAREAAKRAAEAYENAWKVR